ncbi:LysE family transporter [Desulfosporosinus sp. FKA]|uniref:LysE family translocator n=1 Tax=Desulfosporosinus sp. FKA TaxID=1969834 RepID=UPI000B4A1013|nr:LysE family transporter [Desulfosporosinus sp. FKA]
MLFKGFKFGMILQLAIGPVCLFIFKMGGNKGFLLAELGVAGAALIDALYIFLATAGITSFIEKERVKKVFKVIGAIIVGMFGLQTIFGGMGLGKLSNLKLMGSGNSFVEGLLLTASNPLTILFWTGLFSAKLVDEKLTRKEIYMFGLGSVLSTILFLSIIAFIGSVTRQFLPSEIISILNLVVGIILIYFAFRMIIKSNY